MTLASAITIVPISQKTSRSKIPWTLEITAWIWSIARAIQLTIDTSLINHFLVESHACRILVKFLFLIVKVEQTHQLNVVFAAQVVSITPNVHIRWCRRRYVYTVYGVEHAHWRSDSARIFYLAGTCAINWVSSREPVCSSNVVCEQCQEETLNVLGSGLSKNYVSSAGYLNFCFTFIIKIIILSTHYWPQTFT